jgi:aspartokinase-like uncharacterized kinase
MQGPFVMKIGGSLIDQVPGIARALLSSTGPVLIIPGGGPFTNLVRTLHAADNESHWMAVLGMGTIWMVYRIFWDQFLS